MIISSHSRRLLEDLWSVADSPEERLDVLRGLIAEITNSAKNSKPVTTDSQLLSLIRKRVKISEAAAAEFQSAEREDLRNREIAQISMLHEYIQDSDSISEEAITKAVQDVISNMKTRKKDVSRGIVMKALIGPGGSLEGQMVDNSEVARIVGGMM